MPGAILARVYAQMEIDELVAAYRGEPETVLAANNNSHNNPIVRSNPQWIRGGFMTRVQAPGTGAIHRYAIVRKSHYNESLDRYIDIDEVWLLRSNVKRFV